MAVRTLRWGCGPSLRLTWNHLVEWSGTDRLWDGNGIACLVTLLPAIRGLLTLCLVGYQVLQRAAVGKAKVLSHKHIESTNMEDARIFRDDKGKIR